MTILRRRPFEDPLSACALCNRDNVLVEQLDLDQARLRNGD